MGVPQNGWFRVEIPLKMGTHISGNLHKWYHRLLGKKNGKYHKKNIQPHDPTGGQYQAPFCGINKYRTMVLREGC